MGGEAGVEAAEAEHGVDVGLEEEGVGGVEGAGGGAYRLEFTGGFGFFFEVGVGRVAVFGPPGHLAVLDALQAGEDVLAGADDVAGNLFDEPFVQGEALLGLGEEAGVEDVAGTEEAGELAKNINYFCTI